MQNDIEKAIQKTDEQYKNGTAQQFKMSLITLANIIRKNREIILSALKKQEGIKAEQFDAEYKNIIVCPSCNEVLYNAIYFSQTKSIQTVKCCYHCGQKIGSDENEN